MVNSHQYNDILFSLNRLRCPVYAIRTVFHCIVCGIQSCKALVIKPMLLNVEKK